MRLDSVRELKESLPSQLNQTFAVRAAAGKTSDLAVVRAAALKHDTPSYFLGVSARGKKNYRLAVRLQDRALEGDPGIDPEALWGWSGDLPYSVEIGWRDPSADRPLEVLTCAPFVGRDQEEVRHRSVYLRALPLAFSTG